MCEVLENIIQKILEYVNISQNKHEISHPFSQEISNIPIKLTFAMKKVEKVESVVNETELQEFFKVNVYKRPF